MADENKRTFSFPILLSCKNQSMWEDSTTAAVAADTGKSLYVTINENPPPVDSFVDLPILGTFGCQGKLDIKGTTLGLQFQARATAGSVDISCPVGVRFSYPDYVTENDIFRVDTSYEVDKTAVMNTYSPNVGMSLLAHVEGRFSTDVLVKAFGASLLDFNLHTGKASDPRFPAQDVEIFHFDLQSLAALVTSQLPLEYPPKSATQAPVITGDINFPVINTTGVRNDTRQALESDGSDSVLQLELSITDLIVFILQKVGIEIPPFSNDLSFPDDEGSSKGTSTTRKDGGSHAFEVSVAYELLKLWLRGELGFYQSFKFTPTPSFWVTANDGTQKNTTITPYLDSQLLQPALPGVMLPVGTSLWFRMPPSGSVQITPTVFPGAQLENTTGTYLEGGIGLDPLVLSVEGEVAGISLPSFDFAPLNVSKTFPQRIPIKTLKPAVSLEGEKVVMAPSFSVPVHNPPMARLASYVDVEIYPFNNPEPTNSEPKGALSLLVLSDGPDWPSTASATRQLWIWLDDTLLDAHTVAPTLVQINIPPHLLTPGHHTLRARVQFGAENLIPDQPILMDSALDFDVPHFVPRLYELHLANADDESAPVTDMAVVPDNLTTNGRKTAFFVQGAGFAPDTHIVLVNKATGKEYPVARDKNYSSDAAKIFFCVPNQVLSTPGIFSVHAVNRCSARQQPTPGKDGLYSNALPLHLLSATPMTFSTEPATLILDGPECWFTINGQNFRRGVAVEFCGNRIETRYVSDRKLSVRLPAGYLAHERYGSYRGLTTTIGATAAPPPQNAFLVYNPEVPTHSGMMTGGYSQEHWISLLPQPPKVTAVSPAQLAYGGAPTVITINGKNFLPGSMLLIGPRQTRLTAQPGSTSEQISFTIPSDQLFEPGVMEVVLINPYYPTAATGARIGLRVEAPICRCTKLPPVQILAANLDPQQPLPGVDTMVALGSRLAGLNHMTGRVYVYAEETGQWTQVGDGCVELTANESALYKLDALGQVWKGDDSGQPFRALPANVKLAAVLPCANDLYGLRSDGIAHRWLGSSWAAISPSANLTQHAVSKNDVFFIGKDNRVYRYTRTGLSWEVCGNEYVRRIITSPLSTYLLAESMSGMVVRYDFTKGAWFPVTPAGKQYSLGPSSLYILTAGRDILRFDLATGVMSGIGKQAGGVCATTTNVYAFMKP